MEEDHSKKLIEETKENVEKPKENIGGEKPKEAIEIMITENSKGIEQKEPEQIVKHIKTPDGKENQAKRKKKGEDEIEQPKRKPRGKKSEKKSEKKEEKNTEIDEKKDEKIEEEQPHTRPKRQATKKPTKIDKQEEDDEFKAEGESASEEDEEDFFAQYEAKNAKKGKTGGKKAKDDDDDDDDEFAEKKKSKGKGAKGGKAKGKGKKEKDEPEEEKKGKGKEKGKGKQKPEKQKPEKFDEEKATQEILQYMKEKNRPYSAQNIFDNLHKRYSKKAIEKIMITLNESKEIQIKEIGNATIYLCAQDKWPQHTEEEFDELKSKIEDANKELIELKKSLNEKNKVLKDITAQPSNEKIQNDLLALSEKKKELETRLAFYKSADYKKASEEDLKKTEARNQLAEREYRKRKRWCKDILQSIYEGNDEKEQVINENIGINEETKPPDTK